MGRIIKFGGFAASVFGDKHAAGRAELHHPKNRKNPNPIWVYKAQAARYNTRMSRPVNVRKPEVMEQVYRDIACYTSPLVETMRAADNCIELANVRLYLAKAFGFCDGVRRAIEIAYAACRMFPERRLWLIGEIIHNPEVNRRLDAMGLRHLPWDFNAPAYADLGSDDVVIMPAFGVPTALRRRLDASGATLVDSTCGNVVKVWQRVKTYAKAGITSVIHGKPRHEETQATAAQSQGEDGLGHYIIINKESDARLLAEYICGRVSEGDFAAHFAGCTSAGFTPAVHLQRIGIANQTTMLKSETARIQELLRAAVTERDGDDAAFHAFDTICNATQDRQNALFELLEKPLDAMFIIGGYNSSNTTHLAQIAARKVRTYFVKSADCLISTGCIRCWDFERRQETEQPLPLGAADLTRTAHIGITAGASCPDNVIEEVLRRLAELRCCPLES